MASLYRFALILLILQVYVSAAPSDAPKNKEKELEKLDAQSTPLIEKNNVNTTENQRQKRFYNHFGLPPYPPPVHSYNKRDQAADLGVYGLVEDPLTGIHRQLQEIASATRQISPPPPPLITTHLPLFFPVFFIPQYGCQCNPPSTTTKPKPQDPATPDKPAGEGTSPNIENRFPDMEDERQNWGLVNDDTEEDDNGEDFSRPISFDPIMLNVSTMRPPPPVEHGSNQAGQGGVQTVTTTTVRPAPSGSKIPSPPLMGTAAAAPYPPSIQPSRESPSTCDSAVLSCCHMPKVTYDCFAALGCPDPTSYGNPCDPLVILKVISKFQSFYNVKTG